MTLQSLLKQKLCLCLSVFGLAYSGSPLASEVPACSSKYLSTASDGTVVTTSPGTGTVDSVSITSMYKSDGTGTIFPTTDIPGPIYATSCYGVNSGNDDASGLNEPYPNIGTLGDGLLNGEGGLVSPTQFISPSQLLDLDKNGTFTDPGWIHLAHVDSENGLTYSEVDGSLPGTLSVDDVLTFSMQCTSGDLNECSSGSWKLVTKLDIVTKVYAELGRNSFDHLAFVIKAGNEKAGDAGWAIYDFDFNILLQQFLQAGGEGFDYVTPYTFEGKWNTDDFLHKNGDHTLNFSHISVWARDPLADNNVPEPSALLLLGIALIGLGFSSRKQAT